MSDTTDCGCNGYQCCPEERMLHAEINRRYEEAKNTDNWGDYDKARIKYWAHFGKKPPGMDEKDNA